MKGGGLGQPNTDITQAGDITRTFADQFRNQRGHFPNKRTRQAEPDTPRPVRQAEAQGNQHDQQPADNLQPWLTAPAHTPNSAARTPPVTHPRCTQEAPDQTNKQQAAQTPASQLTQPLQPLTARPPTTSVAVPPAPRGQSRTDQFRNGAGHRRVLEYFRVIDSEIELSSDEFRFREQKRGPRTAQAPHAAR